MILVDTSIWIEFFRGTGSKHHLLLHKLIEEEEDVCLTGIITEILHGIRSDRDFRQVKRYLFEFPIFSLKGAESHIEAAQIYRMCRKRGFTIRRPIDCIIAVTAIENDLVLLHNDRDFDAIAQAIKKLQIYKV